MGSQPADQDLAGHVRVRRRPDLVVAEHGAVGARWYVVKDPATLKYCRLAADELFLLDRCDGRRGLPQLRAEFAAAFPGRRLSLEHLEAFVRRALQMGLADADTPRAGLRLHERGRQQAWQRRRQALANFMSLKAPLLNPDRLLDRALPWCGWLFSLPAVLVSLAFMLSALVLAGTHWGEFQARLPSFHDFFHSRWLPWLWVAIGVAKTLHEFGHGLACKRYGGEVHETGLMLLVLSPALYCNVSDAWLFKSRWRRLAVAAAGVHVELLIAAAATWVWWRTGPGLANYLALALMTVCTVSTVLFNANPLLKFDGYYMLADALEVPNLRERANRCVGRLAGLWAFGREVQPDPYAPRRGRAAFALFALASYAYKWVVAFGIVTFLWTFLKPYRLQSLGAALAAGTVFSMAVLPGWRMFQTTKREWRTMKVRRSRVVRGVASLAAVLGAALLCPFPDRVDLPLLVRARGAKPVFVPLAGRLVEINVVDGQAVFPGMLLARLENAELEAEHEKLQGEQARLGERLAGAQAEGDARAAAEAADALAAARAQLDYLTAQRAKLALRAPADAGGAAFSPPRPEALGQWFAAGATLCELGDPHQVEGFAVASQDDLPLLRVGADAWAKVRGHYGPIRSAIVERLGEAALDELPAALSDKTKGGAIPTGGGANPGGTNASSAATGGQGGSAPGPGGAYAHAAERAAQQPLARSYAVYATLQNPDGDLRPGARGYLRVAAPPRALLSRMLRFLDRTFFVKL